MQSLKNVKILRTDPLIVLADAITAAPARNAFRPPSGLVDLHGSPHVIEAGSACGANFPGIKVGDPMLMQLRKA